MAIPRNIRDSASQIFYQDHQAPQYRALLAITELPHPDRAILGHFLLDAQDPQEASCYLLRETAADDALRIIRTRTIWEILSDWKSLITMLRPIVATGLSADTKRLVYERDGGRCCLTQSFFKSPDDPTLRFVHIVPPRGVMNPDLVEGGRLFEMLCAFLSKDSINLLRSIPSSSSKQTQNLGNIWLLSVSAFELMQCGVVWFGLRSWDQDNSCHRQSYDINTNLFRYRTRSELPIASSVKMLVLEDKTTGQALIPQKDLLDFYSMLSKSLAWMDTRKYMVEQQNRASVKLIELPLPSTLLFGITRWIWTTLPSVVRASAYEMLFSVGSYVYGRPLSPRVQQVPFGLYLRKGQLHEAVQHRAEARTLVIVEKLTTIPAPRAIDVLTTPHASYLLMTKVPGNPIDQLLDTMTDKEVDRAVTDLRRYIAELRAIPNQVREFQICNSEGGGILDWRIPDSQSDELRFRTEAEFHNYLTGMMADDTRMRAAKSHAIPHAIVFTHGDLNPRNILAEHGRITGIVDWENAGFFPEYWEYTKMHYTVRGLIRWLADVVDQVFEGYRDELHVENMLSDLTGPF